MPTQPVATTMLPIDKIHPNPNQPRKFFDPQAIEDLKESMAQRGLICPIAVVKSSESDYTIVAGERRYRAARELKWDQIDCRIWPAETTPQEVEMLSLVENIQRTDLSPIEIGNGYKQLTLAPFNMSQEELAKQCGQSRGTVSQYLMIGGLDPQVQEFAKRLANLSFGILLQICRLKSPEDQLELAKKASNEDWTVKVLAAEVDKRLGKSSSHSPAPLGFHARSAPSGSPAPADPLADVWPALSPSLRTNTYWEAKYGVHKPAPGTTMNGWFFFAMPHEVDNPKGRLAEWFAAMARALGAVDHETTRPRDHEKEGHDLDISQSRGPEVSKSEPRLPQNDQELAELEQIAAGSPGPQPVYSWIYGPHNELTMMMEGRTWAEMGVQDPKEGLKKLIAGVKMMEGQEL